MNLRKLSDRYFVKLVIFVIRVHGFGNGRRVSPARSELPRTSQRRRCRQISTRQSPLKPPSTWDGPHWPPTLKGNRPLQPKGFVKSHPPTRDYVQQVHPA